MKPFTLYMFDAKLVKIVSLLSLIQAIVKQANSLGNRSTCNLGDDFKDDSCIDITSHLVIYQAGASSSRP